MNKSKKKSRKATKSNDSLLHYLKFQILAIILYSLVFLISSAVSVAADLNKDSAYYISVISMVVSGFVVSFIYALKKRKNGIISGIIATLPVNIVILLVSAILNKMSINIYALYSFLITLAVSAISGILAVNVKLRK